MAYCWTNVVRIVQHHADLKYDADCRMATCSNSPRPKGGVVKVYCVSSSLEISNRSNMNTMKKSFDVDDLLKGPMAFSQDDIHPNRIPYHITYMYPTKALH